MRQFLYDFFLSWTSTFTVTGFYLLSRLLEDTTDRHAASWAATVGFTILFIAAAYRIAHRRWIRPTGYLLVREDVLARLVANYDENQA